MVALAKEHYAEQEEQNFDRLFDSAKETLQKAKGEQAIEEHELRAILADLEDLLQESEDFSVLNLQTLNTSDKIDGLTLQDLSEPQLDSDI